MGKALAEAVRRMNEKRFLWCVGASFMLDSRGILPGFRDLDFVVSKEGCQSAEEILGKLGEIKTPKAPDSRFVSDRFLEFKLDSIELDLICGLCVRRDGYIYRLVFDSLSVAGDALLEGERVPLAAPEDWFVLYMMMPDREEKALAIARYLEREGVTRPALLRRARTQPLPPALAAWIDRLLLSA